MLIYFLLISLGLFFFIKTLLRQLLENDLKKFLSLLLEIEIGGEKNLESLKTFLLKLRLNTTINHLELLLLKNIELKLIKKIK
jgi:hypothetical protein